MFGLGTTELIILLILAVIFIPILIALIIFFVFIGKRKQRNVPQNTVMNLLQNNEMPKSHNDGDVTNQIRKLGELKAQGLLSEEEFQHKKTELLSRL